MISPRLLVTLTLLAAVCALPTTDKPILKPVITEGDIPIDDAPWFSFPAFGSLFAPIWKFLPTFSDIAPKILADDDKFQVVVSVKDYTKEELKVKVKGDFIFVQGNHEAKQDNHDVFASSFFHTYTLPANCSGSDVTAQLSNDGFLLVTAPLNGKVDRTQDTENNNTKDIADRDVPIVETNEPYRNNSTTSTTTTQAQSQTPTVTTAASSAEDDRKEPTTPPSNREELTVKDNLIPHGNEIPL